MTELDRISKIAILQGGYDLTILPEALFAIKEISEAAIAKGSTQQGRRCIYNKRSCKMSKAQRMTYEQYVDVTDWCKDNKERIERLGWTQLQAAQEATIALGFAVPLSSMQRCAKKVKIKWANSPPKSPEVPIDHEAIVILIGAIAGLYVETGKTIPDNLANLQSSYVRE